MISNQFSWWVAMSSLAFTLFVWLIILYALIKKRISGGWWLAPLTAIILFGWLGGVVTLAKNGFFTANPLLAPNILLGFLVLFEVLRRVFASAAMQKIAAGIPVPWLIGIQTYRVAGVGFLMLYKQNLLPAVFAFSAGYGDILVGVTAPIVAVLYYLKKSYSRQLAVVWNYVGVADLVVAITVGILAFPSPIRFLPTAVSTEQMALFPLAVVPLFVVPLALVLHLFGLEILKVAK